MPEHIDGRRDGPPALRDRLDALAPDDPDDAGPDREAATEAGDSAQKHPRDQDQEPAPESGGLTDRQRDHIEKIMKRAREHNPEGLAAAREQIAREREDGTREETDGLTDGDRALIEAGAVGPGPFGEPRRHGGDS